MSMEKPILKYNFDESNTDNVVKINVGKNKKKDKLELVLIRPKKEQVLESEVNEFYKQIVNILLN